MPANSHKKELLRAAAALAVILAWALAGSLPGAASGRVKPDPKKARQAFLEASKVFLSPRCTNCHTAGDIPTQTDSSSDHPEGIVRGKEGKGTEDLACTLCHADQNTDDGAPGVPNWHMPPPEMKMIFQGRTPGQLCRQIKDPKQNGGKTTLAESVHHMETDHLVLWAWAPGTGRTIPPMSHADFMARMKTWVDNGGACPD
jgi:hypothetical protein